MTTICSDGCTVAADGQETWGSEAVSLTREKLRSWNGKIYGFTGVGALFEPCIRWVDSGADPNNAPEAKGDNNSWGLCVFEPDGVVYYSNNAPYPHRYSYPFAVGAGCDYAMGAMLAGASPGRAVEIAAEKNIHTGGKILVLPVPIVAMSEAAE